MIWYFYKLVTFITIFSSDRYSDLNAIEILVLISWILHPRISIKVHPNTYHIVDYLDVLL